MVQAQKEVSEGSEVPTDTHHTPIVTQPSSSQPQKKQKSRRKQRKETEAPHTEPQTKESVLITSSDPLPSDVTTGENVEQSTKDAKKRLVLLIQLQLLVCTTCVGIKRLHDDIIVTTAQNEDETIPYFTNHALWEVIVNSDSVSPVASASAGVKGHIPPKTAKQKLARKNKLKAKNTLMLAIPDEHILKFHACKDAKTLWETIKNRFGGNKESKKMQKIILKQNYENFVEDANLKLLRSLPSAWNNIALIMRNKFDLDTLSMDDLYNNLKTMKIWNKIDTDDLEEMDLKWQVALRNQGNRNRDAPTKNAPVDTSTTNALVVQDGIDDSKDENVFKPKEVKKTVKPSLEKIKFVNARNTTIENENKAEKPRKFSQSPMVVSAVERNRNNAVKSSACWIWRPKGNLIDHISKDNGSYTLKRFNYVDPQGRLKSDQWIFDSGCSRHMTRNKSYLTDYQEIDGGFVSFGGNAKGERKATQSLLCDNGTEFKNRIMNELCEMKGIRREFNVSRTPQQNGVVERKNRTLIEASKTMLEDSKLLITFWAEAVNTACYVQNRVLVIKPHNKTPYELFLGRKPVLSFIKPFGCPAIILNTLDHLEDEVADYARKKSTEVPRKENEVQDPAKEGRERAQRNGFESMFGQDKDANGNMMFTPVSVGGSTYVNLGGSIPVNVATLHNADLPTDPLMPDLEDTADLQDTGIFSVVNHIPITRIHMDHPKDKIIGDPLLAPQTGRRPRLLKNMLWINEQEVPDEFYGGAHFLFRVAVKTTSTPIETNKALLKDVEAEDVDVHLCRSVIGSSVYLTTSRPNIMFVVCACARFQVTPQVSHLHAVKRIFRYLKGQPKLGLWYPRDSPFDLEAFSDSDYAEASLDMKFTTEVYTSCIEYFCATVKVKNVNGEAQIQALVDKKKVIIIEASIKRDLRFKDEGGVDRLSNEVIFEQLTLTGTMASAIIYLTTNQKFNFSKYIFDNMVKHLDGGVKFMMHLRFVQVFLDNQVEGMDRHNAIFVISSHIKKVFANMKREGKDLSGKVTPLFPSMIVQALEDKDEGLKVPTDPHRTPIVTQPSSSPPQKKQKSRKKQKKEIEVPLPSSEIPNEEGVPATFNDPPPSGEDRMQLNELMILCTNLQKQVLDLEEAKTAQAKEIASLKKRVKKLEQKRKSRTLGLKRLRKERIIDNIDQDVEITLVDDTQRRMNEEDMFRVNDLDGDEVVVDVSASEKVKRSVKVVKKEVSTADPVTTAGIKVTTAATTPQISKDDLTLAQTLIEIKAAKPKAITTAAITVTATVIRPKEKGIVMQEPSETPSPKPTISSKKPSQAKDKGRGKMMQAKLKEEERLARLKEKETNIALVVQWDNTQAMMDADYELAARLQEEEKGELSIEDKSRLFVEIMDKRKKHFARLRAEKIRSKPPTKAQKRNQIEKAVEDSKKAKEGSSKRARSNVEQEDAKRQRLEEENESAELKICLEIILEDDDDVTIEATPISSKSPTILDYKIYKEEKKSFFKIIKADDVAEECKKVLDEIENICPQGIPDAFVNIRLQEIVSIIFELLPQLWAEADQYEETVYSYRRALISLDSMEL
nr:ribonuclease H-like domain-containing protein [Tanacetum cinerariifolium]